LINGQPAWCAEVDAHLCPLVNGVQPHVGGVVMEASITVLIDGFPAARMGDEVVEAGGPNPIAEGSPDVLIGD
jgi:uncharacterized Zn-binding protein involved in type VI secretion